MRVCERNGFVNQCYSTTEAWWTTLEFTAASEDSVLRVIIIKAKELTPLDI